MGANPVSAETEVPWILAMFQRKILVPMAKQFVFVIARQYND